MKALKGPEEQKLVKGSASHLSVICSSRQPNVHVG